uniref:Uncharacterized protein n=1 Tax=Moniliophthora roreri TaxID=221103 RepID=A0A0W0G056_MONRR
MLNAGVVMNQENKDALLEILPRLTQVLVDGLLKLDYLYIEIDVPSDLLAQPVSFTAKEIEQIVRNAEETLCQSNQLLMQAAPPSTPNDTDPDLTRGEPYSTVFTGTDCHNYAQNSSSLMDLYTALYMATYTEAQTQVAVDSLTLHYDYSCPLLYDTKNLDLELLT